MKTKVTQQQVKEVNNQVKNKMCTLGGCISTILANAEKEDTNKEFINFLVKCKKDKDTYSLLNEECKPNKKSGTYNRYATLQAVARILNK
jgi:hypothetical protein